MKRWLSGSEHLLLSQKTQVLFKDPHYGSEPYVIQCQHIWCSFNSSLAMEIHVIDLPTYRQNICTHKINYLIFLKFKRTQSQIFFGTTSLQTITWRLINYKSFTFCLGLSHLLLSLKLIVSTKLSSTIWLFCFLHLLHFWTSDLFQVSWHLPGVILMLILLLLFLSLCPEVLSISSV